MEGGKDEQRRSEGCVLKVKGEVKLASGQFRVRPAPEAAALYPVGAPRYAIGTQVGGGAMGRAADFVRRCSSRPEGRMVGHLEQR